MKVTSESHELWSRAKRVMGWSCSMTLLWRNFLECSSSLLTSSSLCPHSYGGRFWSVLPHTAHFVIPVISLLWRKVLECSSSLLTSLSLCPHSLRHPCVLTPITRVTTHPILSVLTLTHTHRTNPSHLTLSLPSLVLPCSLIPACSHITPTTTHSHECSHTECSHTHRHP